MKNIKKCQQQLLLLLFFYHSLNKMSLKITHKLIFLGHWLTFPLCKLFLTIETFSPINF